jgi:PhzF family phenazine biosynthesis protein
MFFIRKANGEVSMNIRYFQVDTFTNKRFTGNPAGVCLLGEPISDELMQKIAAQTNLSETAFLLGGVDHFLLRWFTPTIEIALCGHATLATAQILWESGILAPATSAQFQTKSGLIRVDKKDDWLAMTFPVFTCKSASIPPELIDVLKINPVYSGEVFDRYLFELSSEKEITDLNPDFAKLKYFKKVLLTSKSNAGSAFDFISRYFAPSIGVNEDPVTGTSHSCLASYWSEKLNKNELIGYQASKRGGIVKMSLNPESVIISGQAITVLRGELTV